MRAVSRICIAHPGLCLTPEEKSWKTSLTVSERRSADQRRCDSFSRLGHRQAMALTGMLAPAAFGFRVRRRGKPSVSVDICRVCSTRVSQRQPSLSSSSVVVGKERNNQYSRESDCYLRARGTRRKAHTLGLQYLQRPDVDAGSGPPCGTCINHHGADEQFL